MLRKRDPNLGVGWRAGARRLTCEFNARCARRAKPVKIFNAGAGTRRSRRGGFLPHVNKPRSVGYHQQSARWYQFEALRDGFTLRRACNPVRWLGSAAPPAARRMRESRMCVVACVIDGYSPVFFLFCLTGGPIFDNRHGLHPKCDGGRAVKTLSAAKPHV